MSSTSKERLSAIKDNLDHAFANAHPDDRQEMVKEMREYLNRQNAAAKAPGYDTKHSNAATGSF